MRPTYAEVDLSAVESNVRQVIERVRPAQVMAVVKANAYGHGAVEVARVAVAAGAAYLGVALVEEGIALRDAGVDAPILVFGGFFDDQVEAFVERRLQATLFDLHSAEVLDQAAQRSGGRHPVHVKLDTGMGRVGVDWRQAVDFLEQVRRMEGLEVVGLMTHLATADERDKTFARTQLCRFREAIRSLEESGVQIPIKHAANSAAILDLPEAWFDLVRLGVMLYGYYPSEETSESIPVVPAMRLVSHVIYLKTVAAGTPVSYGRRYTTEKETRIATVPIGYADGYNRLLSNQGEVLIRGRRFPVVGRVCMDQIMVDVGLTSDVRIGDEVVLLGRQGDAEIPIWEICRKLGTIPYEVTCWVSSRVPRRYLPAGQGEGGN